METMNDLLVDVINSLGGSKVVGVRLWPELLVEAAQRKLLDCLNPERPARLDPEQVLYLFYLARAKGVHTPMEFLSTRLSYQAPIPQQSSGEKAELQRKFIESVADMQQLLERINQLDAVDQPRVRAVRSGGLA